jgi:ribonuclease R
VNAAKSAGTLGANQSKSKATRKNGKSKTARAVGKPAGSKPPVRSTNARRKK